MAALGGAALIAGWLMRRGSPSRPSNVPTGLSPTACTRSCGEITRAASRPSAKSGRDPSTALAVGSRARAPSQQFQYALAVLCSRSYIQWVLLDWSAEFDRWLDRMVDKADRGDAHAQLVLGLVTAELEVLQELSAAGHGDADAAAGAAVGQERGVAGGGILTWPAPRCD